MSKAKPKTRRVVKQVCAVFAHPDVSDSAFLLLACGHWLIRTLTETQARWSDSSHSYGGVECPRCER